MSGVVREEGIKKEYVRYNIGLASIVDQMREK